MVLHTACRVVIVTLNIRFWIQLMMICTYLSFCWQNLKQMILDTTNYATHLFLMHLSLVRFLHSLYDMIISHPYRWYVEALISCLKLLNQTKNKETSWVPYFYTFVGYLVLSIPTTPTIYVHAQMQQCTWLGTLIFPLHFPLSLPPTLFITHNNSMQLGHIHHWLITRLDILLFDWKHGGYH